MNNRFSRMFRNVMPDDHTPIDLRVANSSRSVNTCFIAKTNQLVELLEANEFDTASILVDETLANYKIFKDKKLADNNFYQSSINSFDACWQLVSTVLKIKTKKMEAQQLNLFEIRMEIEQAFHSSATSKLLFMILKELRVIFLENFLMVAANSCVQLSLDETMEKNKGNFLLNDDFISEGIEECELQLTYLLYLFRFSIRVSQNPYFKTAEMRASDEAFKDLLNSLDVQEHSSKMPSIIGSPEEASKLYEYFIHLLEGYKSLKEQANFMDSDAIELMEYNSLMWPASLHHLMYFFEPNHEKKNILLASSINRFDFLMKERFTRDHIRRFFVDKPNLEIQRHYKFLLEANCENYRRLIQISKNTVAATFDFQQPIKELNLYLSNFIVVGLAHLHYLDWIEKVPEIQKIYLLKEIGQAYRTFIRNEIWHNIAMDQSKIYFKRMGKITSSEEFRENPIVIFQDLVGMRAEELIALADQDSFIQKFRRDFRVKN